LQWLVADLPMALSAGIIASAELNRLTTRFCPGPLTIVAPVVGGATIGFRIPAHPFVHALLQELREPLAATSANRSGEPPGTTLAAATTNLTEMPEVGVDAGQIVGAASTVVDLSVAPWRILRAGPISQADLATALAETPQ